MVQMNLNVPHLDANLACTNVEPTKLVFLVLGSVMESMIVLIDLMKVFVIRIVGNIALNVVLQGDVFLILGSVMVRYYCALNIVHF